MVKVRIGVEEHEVSDETLQRLKVNSKPGRILKENFEIKEALDVLLFVGTALYGTIAPAIANKIIRDSKEDTKKDES